MEKKASVSLFDCFIQIVVEHYTGVHSRLRALSKQASRSKNRIALLAMNRRYKKGPRSFLSLIL